MEEKRILVVDDDTANLTMANNILSMAGMRASCVKSGERALRFLTYTGLEHGAGLAGKDGFCYTCGERQEADSGREERKNDG